MGHATSSANATLKFLTPIATFSSNFICYLTRLQEYFQQSSINGPSLLVPTTIKRWFSIATTGQTNVIMSVNMTVSKTVIFSYHKLMTFASAI